MLIKKILDAIKNIDISEGDIEKAIKYLKAYQYLKTNDLSPGEFLDAVLKFNKNFGLDDSKGFTLQTLTAMSWRRCGCPDALFEAATDNNKWAFSHLKYYIEDFVPGLTKDEQRFLTRESANDASAVCGLTFEEVFNSNQANIVFRTGRNNGLGTPGDVLAYAYLPSSPNHTRQLETVFDLADLWIKDRTKRGILYKNVCSHEGPCGHIVGLSHSQVKTALMAPFYDPDVATPQADDKRRLQARYGKPVAIPEPEPPPTPAPTPEPEPRTPNKYIIEITGHIREINIPGFRIYKG